MPELIAKAAIEAEALHLAGLTLSVRAPVTLSLIAPFPGREEAVAAALQPMGLGFPAPGLVCRSGETRLIWAGPGQALLMACTALLPAPLPASLGDQAAMTDQSDGWTCLELRGDMASEALSRLVPIDLRQRAFGPGRSACTVLGQIPLLLVCETPEDEAELFLLLVPRSMARSAWRGLSTVLHNLEARQNLRQH